MSRKFSDQKNLLEASRIRRSGFQTKVHASPHKKEIDEWLTKYRWSSQMIGRELERLYPGENHPSDRTIDNYKNKYLPEEFAKAAKSSAYPEEIRDRLVNQFDPAIEGVELWAKTKKAVAKASNLMEKTQIPPKILVDLLRAAGQNYQIVCDRFANLGLIKEVPKEFEITENKKYDGKQYKSKLEELIAIKKAIKELEDSGVTVGVGDGDGDGDSEEGHSEEEVSS